MKYYLTVQTREGRRVAHWPLPKDSDEIVRFIVQLADSVEAAVEEDIEENA